MAWYEQRWSDLYVNGIAFPIYSDLDIQEEVVPRDFGVLEDNLNGVMDHMYGTNPANSQKVDITWTASNVRRPPAFSNRFRGIELIVGLIKPWEIAVPAGQISVVLERDPRPGSVYVEDLASGAMLLPNEFAVDGRTVSWGSRPDVVVGFKPFLTVLFDTRRNGSSEFKSNSTSWTFNVREK